MRSAIHIIPSRLRVLCKKWSLRDASHFLAAKLRLDVPKLESLVFEQMLQRAKEWSTWKQLDSVGPGMSASASLQKDVSCAVEWLCLLTDRTFDYYYDKWAAPPRGGTRWFP